jgi:hypothetical protein
MISYAELEEYIELFCTHKFEIYNQEECEKYGYYLEDEHFNCALVIDNIVEDFITKNFFEEIKNMN